VSDFAERMSRFVSRLRSGPLPLPTVTQIPPRNCLPQGVAGREIEKDRSYFTVQINELYLAEGRSWWATFDPMVLVIVDFVYGRQTISIPKFIGPNLIDQKLGKVPHGFLINDIAVAGPHPFRGGRLGISVILYKVKKHDYATGLLKFVEEVSSSIGIPADMATLGKVGGAVLQGVETLLELGDTTPLAGHRIEIDGASINGLVSSFSALIAGQAVPPSSLRVEDGRLLVETAAGTDKFAQSDYVLYSLVGMTRRGDERTLPFYSLLEQSLNAALSAEEAGLKRAKAGLLTLYQQMVASPDLTSAETDALFDSYQKDMVAKYDRGRQIMAMSAGGVRPTLSSDEARLRDAASRLAL
jgi:hypothetical protein